MPLRFRKTPAGHTEIQAKAVNLSRAARNLLLLINESQAGSQWLAQIRGVTEADLAQLVSEGLIESTSVSGGMETAPVSGGSRSRAASTVVAETAATPPSAEAASTDDGSDQLWGQTLGLVRESSYAALYDVLTSQGKAQLGLLKGYRFTLDVEKCDGPAELQAFAQKYLEQLREDHGMSAVRRFYEALRKR
ncbi:hypothetical protein [Ideonella sp.]|uniref:hypothetical protein n=1 Tax=Ideonella sp. TaxID=1929293 RepID=UPI003BB4AEC9